MAEDEILIYNLTDVGDPHAWYCVHTKQQRTYVQEAYKQTSKSVKEKVNITHGVQIYVLPIAFVSFSNTVSKEEFSDAVETVN